MKNANILNYYKGKSVPSDKTGITEIRRGGENLRT
jgi:hypothetical protein